jgi:hypothetical protein
MNHNPSEESANVPSSSRAVVADGTAPTEQRTSTHLNSSLQQALSCLDVKLEDELMRFRSKQASQAEDLHAVPATTVTLEQPSTAFDADAEIFTAHIVDPVGAGTIIEDNSNLERVAAPDPAPKGGFIIIDKLITASTTNPDAAAAMNNGASIEVYRSNLPTHESLGVNFGAGGEISPYHDEYSSSSQELLRQIQSGYRDPASERRPQAQPPAPKRKFFTPLKIGSAAVACILAGGAVYTYLNPSVLAPLTATKLVTPTTTTNSLGQLIQSPNLAANEFSELNLSALTTIQPPKTATAVPTTATSTIAAPTGTGTAPAAIPFNNVGTRTIVPPNTAITSQPRLADSLVKSLLPPSFRPYSRPANFRANPAGTGR